MLANEKNKRSGKLKNLRTSISLQMYVILGVFVGLILVASLLGRTSLLQMDVIQKNITERHIPELSNAIKMGQESVSLANVATKLRSAKSEREVQEVRTLIDAHYERLTEILSRLEKISNDVDKDTLAEFKSLSHDLQVNLNRLEQSALVSIKTRKNLNTRAAHAVRTVRELDNLLVSRIDDQTFFLDTGWRTLRQKAPSAPTTRLQKGGVNYYRTLFQIKEQIQLAANLLGEAMQYSSFDLMQPLRERFVSALDTCANLLTTISNASFANEAQEKYETIKELGLGGSGDNAQGELFAKMGEVYKEEQKQEGYLLSNNNIVKTLSAQTEKLIENIQNTSSDTSKLFSQSIISGRNRFLALNIISVILAFLVGFFLVRRNLIGRIKMLSSKMLTLSKGNIKTALNVKGNDEISDMGKALEIFRNYAYEAQKLELVEKLADEVRKKNSTLESTITKLKSAQEQMIMQEKLASLGQLTSGIAHEIKNPLNFITNFSLVSKDLLEDISRELTKAEGFNKESKTFLEDVLRDLYGNMEKINFHGLRANDIVKGMLQHSRGGASGELEEINLHRFLDSTINLAYQGKRSSSSKFNVDIKRSYSEVLDKVKINPQDISRVILNLVTNACDALEEKIVKDTEFSPTIWIATNTVGDKDNTILEVKVRDNGPGVSEELANKIFDPFFTTKPTDKGTGLGLSLAHDIVAKHSGVLKLNRLNDGTEFVIELPLLIA